jgi:hypothetical protein
MSVPYRSSAADSQKLSPYRSSAADSQKLSVAMKFKVQILHSQKELFC